MKIEDIIVVLVVVVELTLLQVAKREQNWYLSSLLFTIDLRIDSFALHLSLSSYLDNQEKQKGYSYDYKTKFKKE